MTVLNNIRCAGISAKPLELVSWRTKSNKRSVSNLGGGGYFLASLAISLFLQGEGGCRAVARALIGGVYSYICVMPD